VKPRHDPAGGDQASPLLEAANLVATVWRGRGSCIISIQCRFTRSPSAGLANTNAIRLQALSDLKKGLEENKNKKS